MLIKECKGYELEKAQSNTSEDFFNRSELTFMEDGEERKLQVLYIRYFDQIFNEFTPYEKDPVWQQGESEILFRDIVALICLIKNPGLRHRKRLYINSKTDFASYFKDVDYNKLTEIFLALSQKRSYDLRSPLEFILQPN